MPNSSASVTFSPQGFSGLAAALQQFPAQAQEIIASATLQAALPVLESAQAKVPVDTGTLKRSLHAEFDEQTATAASVLVGTDVEYGKYVEYGTSRQAAQPYLRPALDENQGAIEKAFIDAFKDLAFEELANRGPRGGVRR